MIFLSYKISHVQVIVQKLINGVKRRLDVCLEINQGLFEGQNFLHRLIVRFGQGFTHQQVVHRLHPDSNFKVLSESNFIY